MFTSTYDNTVCTFNRGLDIYDSVSETWVTYATNEASYPWIDQTSIDANYNFNVVTEDFTTYDNENIDPTVF